MKKILSHPITQLIIAIILKLIISSIEKKYDIFPDWLINNLWFIIVIVVLLLVLVTQFIENRSLKEVNNRLENIEKKKLETRIAELEKRTNKPENVKYQRFEQIKNKKQIIFGHIDYEPFFKMKKKVGSFNPNPSGIGYAILKEIFAVLGVDIKEYPKDGNWSNVFKNLEEKKYDIIVTPLYETRSRIYNNAITYCIPLFYSEIGLFVHKDDFNGQKSMKDIKDEIRTNQEYWKAPYIKGEISEIMAKKLKTYREDDKSIVDDDSLGFLNLLRKVNDRAPHSDDLQFNIVAMEIFKAKAIIDDYNEKNPDNKLELKNILKEKQLLYPVSFIVRKEDTVLRNFVNLRIAELYERHPLDRNQDGKLIDTSGQKSLIDIIKEEAFNEYGIHPSRVDEMFIRTYNFSNLEKYSIY